MTIAMNAMVSGTPATEVMRWCQKVFVPARADAA